MLLKVISEGKRQNREQFLKHLNRYPDTAPLATEARKDLLPLHVEVAQQCNEWGLYDEGLRQISEFNSIRISADEASAIQ